MANSLPMRNDPPYKFYPQVIADDVGGGVIYVGVSSPATATSAGSWQIKKVTTVGGVTTIAWANGKSHFDQIWDNRLSISYS